MKKFGERVWQACKKIPRGRVSTYAALAKKIGAPRAARAVGNALNKSPGMPSVPCHRVVKSDGSVGGFAQGTKVKTSLLKREGVKVVRGKIDLKKFGHKS